MDGHSRNSVFSMHGVDMQPILWAGNFPCVDLLIPLAYIEADGMITPENMPYILISVKNYSGKSHDSLSKQYLEEEFVLGTPN